MGSQGVIEENDLSEPRGGYARIRHTLERARTHARYRGSIRDAYCDVYARLRSSVRIATNRASAVKNTAEKIT